MIKKIIKEILRYDQIKLIMFRRKIAKNYENNYIVPMNFFDLKKVKIGQYSYGQLIVKDFGNKNASLIIGNFCSIADGVQFFLSGEHNYKNLSTYPFKKKIFGITESITKGDIVIEDDVWIGANSIILSGVKIGKGAVIGAGSIVSKEIPPYAIYAGNRIIKYRFSDDMIEKLKRFDFSKLTKEKIENNLELLYQECNENNVDNILKIIK